MADVIPFNSQSPTDSHYPVNDRMGLCPECGSANGYMNVGGNHWFVCDAHRTRWCAGYNLFSCWRDETEELWRVNAAKLEGYRQVKPIFDVPEGATSDGKIWTLRLAYDPSAPMNYRAVDTDDCDVKLTSRRQLTTWQVAQLLQRFLEPVATSEATRSLPAEADEAVPF
jgi:hypothetical protein